jgi:hypothetical protein
MMARLVLIVVVVMAWAGTTAALVIANVRF